MSQDSDPERDFLIDPRPRKHFPRKRPAEPQPTDNNLAAVGMFVMIFVLGILLVISLMGQSDVRPLGAGNSAAFGLEPASFGADQPTEAPTEAPATQPAEPTATPATIWTTEASWAPNSERFTIAEEPQVYVRTDRIDDRCRVTLPAPPGGSNARPWVPCSAIHKERLSP
jgi:hypothetical protein